MGRKHSLSAIASDWVNTPLTHINQRVTPDRHCTLPAQIKKTRPLSPPLPSRGSSGGAHEAALLLFHRLRISISNSRWYKSSECVCSRCYAFGYVTSSRDIFPMACICRTLWMYDPRLITKMQGGNSGKHDVKYLYIF